MDQRRPIEDLLAEAYPNLSKEEQLEAGENLKRHLAACLRTYERLERDAKEQGITVKELMAQKQNPDISNGDEQTD